MKSLTGVRMMVVAVVALTAASVSAQTAMSFYPLTPCRVVDTRDPYGVNGGPIMGNDSRRDFAIRGNCGIPYTARAVTLNVTIANPTATSWLTVWPSGQTRPLASVINFTSSDITLANGATVALSTNSQDLSVYNNMGNVHIIIDVSGYYQ